MLIKDGIVCLTRTEFNELPVTTIQHFLGFTIAQREMEEEKRKESERKNRVRRVNHR